MRIEELHISNFRCFEHLDLNFHPHLNVFIGVNGSGKTAILDAVKYAALGALGKIKGAVESRTVLSGFKLNEKKDLRIQRFERGEFFVSEYVSISGKMEFLDRRFNFNRLMEIATSRYSRGDDYPDFSWVSKNLEKNETLELPIFAYHSTGRLFQDDKATKKELNGARLKGYLNAHSVKSSQKVFNDWFSKRTLSQLQYQSAGINFDFSPFEATKRIICKLIPDCKIITYDFLKFKEIVLVFENGNIVPYSMLSDGVRNLMVLVSDLCWRAATLNPWMGGGFNKVHGIVLIDEVDLHLHPSWQRIVVPRLLEAFPNVQFFLTTHSPQVASSIKKEHLFLIHDNNIENGKNYSEGRDSNSILADIFGVQKRPEIEQKKLDKFYILLEKKEKEKAQEILEYLESIWGALDSEIMRANLYFQDLLDEIHS